MSTFCGEISEIPGVGVDNFSNTTLKCYFVSHCHSDHIREIGNLNNTNHPIYTTELSAFILNRQYSNLNIKILEIGQPTPLEFFHDKQRVNFVVTLLNGGHCMGSCMLLFQIEGLDVLYTGDFRLSLKNAQNIKNLNEIKNYGNLSVYLDTTFMKEAYQYFPEQGDSCKKIIDIVEAHLEASSRNKVVLQVPARYGYERLIIELSRKLNERIFVSEEEVREQYLMISGLCMCISTNKMNSRIIVSPTYKKLDEQHKSANHLNIHLSAMFWTNWNHTQPFVHKMGNDKIRICYATHSSLNEIREFLNFLKPKSVYPTVIPQCANERVKMMKIIDEIVESYRTDPSESEVPKKRFAFKNLRKNIVKKNE